MSQTPLATYRDLVARGEIKPDPAQELAAERLNSLDHALAKYVPKAGKKGWMARFGLGEDDARPPPQGLYLFGGVGRGKSMLMDLFFRSASIKAKLRVHFHEFMRDIHAEIHRFRQMPIDDTGDPIPGMADGIADSATLLCLDELEVRDIADAMIVGRLFQKLFDRGVVVVATSNRHPDDLYKHGLQRERFVPFIQLIKDKLDVLELEARQDYRLGRLAGSTVYHTPLDANADAALDRAWSRLTDDANPTPDTVLVQGRKIPVSAAAHQVARFTFAELCEKPLGPVDYLAIAAQYATIILKDVPRMDQEKRDAARRFVTLVDALYDHRTALICSAGAPPHELYAGHDNSFEFHRTVSRLIEMQAADYFEQRHVED
ncbi:MAG: AFG1 family ATPase [Alphaproteobacteria bacterium]|nr:AFG1 family ATPase [Alphaproteobacteria bacterium]